MKVNVSDEVKISQNQGKLTDALCSVVYAMARQQDYFGQDWQDIAHEQILRLMKYLPKLRPEDAVGWLRVGLVQIFKRGHRNRRNFERNSIKYLEHKLTFLEPEFREAIRINYHQRIQPGKYPRF